MTNPGDDTRPIYLSLVICHRSSWGGEAATNLVFLAFSLRPSHLPGESAVPHSPPRRKERKESANKNSFQAAKDLGLSSTDLHGQKNSVDLWNPWPLMKSCQEIRYRIYEMF